jgi:hypothetical protein
LTSGFHAADNLPVERYRQIMDDSIFVPCPAGNAVVESFRVWEALEAGCIPIVERRGNFDYFATAFGPHPLPIVGTWQEAPELLRRLQADKSWLRVGSACAAWWEATQRRVKERFAAALAPAPETAYAPL